MSIEKGRADWTKGWSSLWFHWISGVVFFPSLQVQTLLLCPVCPHFAEHVWALLGKVSTNWDGVQVFLYWCCAPSVCLSEIVGFVLFVCVFCSCVKLLSMVNL